MKKLFLLFALLIFAVPANAQDWFVGQQTITYTDAHPLGDGVTNPRGGEAPFFANEPNDIPTDATTISNWTMTCTDATHCGGGTTYAGEFADAAGDNGWAPGHESKARFDCDDAFDENSDAILRPHQAGNAPHRHHFFGNIAASGNMASVDYAWLRQHGNSTCYGGPMNRTLYWEPTLYSTVNGVKASKKALNIVTYYVGGTIDPADTAKLTRWPMSIAMIFGFDMNDPTNTRLANQAAASTGTVHPNVTQTGAPSTNGLLGWFCLNPATPSYTTYAPNQSQGSGQPYLNDGNGHATLNCLTSSAGGFPNGIQVYADLVSQDCWDGQNPRAPDGRSHLAYFVAFQDGKTYCPDHWYRIPHFEAKITFVFRDSTEIANAYLSSDRMVGMTQFKGGQSMHADLIPAWDYGTGDRPGFMLKFFQHCDGISMHVKNSDGVTYTDFVGDPHECGFGRISLDTQAFNTGPSPDGTLPNPVVVLNPNLTGKNGYFPIAAGTPLPGAVIHQTH